MYYDKLDQGQKDELTRCKMAAERIGIDLVQNVEEAWRKGLWSGAVRGKMDGLRTGYRLGCSTLLIGLVAKNQISPAIAAQILGMDSKDMEERYFAGGNPYQECIFDIIAEMIAMGMFGRIVLSFIQEITGMPEAEADAYYKAFVKKECEVSTLDGCDSGNSPRKESNGKEKEEEKKHEV